MVKSWVLVALVLSLIMLSSVGLALLGVSDSGEKFAEPLHSPINYEAEPFIHTVGYWSFDGDGDNVSRDFSKNKLDGSYVGNTVNNISGCLPNYDECIHLDGSGDYIHVPNDEKFNLFNPTSEVTVSVWFKMPDVGTNLHGLIAKSTGNDRAFEIFYHGSQHQIYYQNYDGDNYTSVTWENETLQDNRWHHVVVARNGPNPNLTLWIDGDLKTSNSDTELDETNFDNAQPFLIGNDPSVANSWEGSIDDVMLIARELNSSQVLELYHNQSAKFLRSEEIFSSQIDLKPSANITANLSIADLTETVGSNANASLKYWNKSLGYETQDNRELILDSVQDYIRAPVMLDNNTDNYSISVWFKKVGNSEQDQGAIFAQRQYNPGTAITMILHARDDNTIRLAFRDDASNLLIIDNGSYAFNEWNHVAATREGDWGNIYLNGILVGNDSVTLGDMTDGDHVYIGKQNTTGSEENNNFNGSIDDLMTFNHTLTANEVIEIFAEGRTGDYTHENLTHKFTFDEDTVNDALGEANGTLLGNAYLGGVMGYWHLDADNAIDALGLNNGSFVGGYLNDSGVFNGSYTFDGENQYIEITDDDSLEFGKNPFTVSVRFKAVNAENHAPIIGKRQVASPNNGWKMWLSTSEFGEIRFALDGGTPSSPNLEANDGFDYADNEWHHVVAIRDGGGNGSLYVDGVLKDTESDFAHDVAGDVPLRIGDSQDWGTGTLNGSIDEVILFDRALSREEAVNLYLCGKPDCSEKTNGFGINWTYSSTGFKEYEEINNSPNLFDYSASEEIISCWIDGITDYCGGNYNGTLSGGASWSDDSIDVRNLTLEIDGDGDYLDVSNAIGDIRTLEESSISFWIKPADISNSEIPVSFTDLSQNDPYWRLQTLSDGTIRYFLVNDAGSLTLSAATTERMKSGEWTHIVATGTSNSNKIYWDGKLVNLVYSTGSSTTGGSFGSVLSSAVDAGWIGGFSVPVATTYYNGTLDEVAIWNRSLSAGEVQKIYLESKEKRYRIGDIRYDSSAENILPTYNFTSGTNQFYTALIDPGILLETSGEDIVITFENLTTADGANLSQTFISANVSAVLPSGIDTLTVSLYNSTGVYQENTTTTSEIFVNFTSLAEGVYLLNASVNDSSGSTGVTETRRIILDSTAPNGTLLLPGNGSEVANGTQNFSANISDNVGIANATLNIYNSTGSLVNSTVITYASDIVQGVSSVVVTLAEGIYEWFYTIFDWVGNSFITSNNTITVDLSGPNVSGVILSPGSNAGLDPETNVTFNVTIDDRYTSVGSVILQYNNGSDWLNASMYSIGGDFYQTNITLGLIEENYTYNVWANDSVGNSNLSTNVSFESAWDCTWSVVPSTLTEGGFNENKLIGHVNITNTGDVQHGNNNCTLSFQMDHNLSSGRIYFNNDPNNEFITTYLTGSISAKDDRNITVNASFLSETEQEEVTLLVNEISGRSNSSNKNVSATIVSSSGAYLYQTVLTSPTNVSLTYTNFSILSSLVNLGWNGSDSNTAFNATFNYSLPENFTISDGNQSSFYSNLSDKLQRLQDINVTFNSTNLPHLGPGVYTISINSFGYENSTGNLSLISHSENTTLLEATKTITLECYNVSDGIYVTACGDLDADKPEEAGSGGSGASAGSGGSGSGGGGSGVVKSEADFQIVRGRENSFTVPFENKENKTLRDLEFSVTGRISQYIDVFPDRLSELQSGSEVDIILVLTSPTFIDLGRQDITLVIKAEGYTERKRIILEIHEISKSEALELIQDAELLVESFNDNFENSGLINLEEEVGRLEVLLGIMKEDLDGFDIEGVVRNYNIIKKDVENALDSSKIITELDALILDAEEKGISVSGSKRIVSLAKLSLERGEFERALERAREAQVTYALEVKGEFGNVQYYLKNNPREISLGVLFLALLGFVSYKTGKVQHLRSRIKKLREEESIINELMKVVQVEAFKKKMMSMDEYKEYMYQYEKKMEDVVEKLIELENKREHALRFTSQEKRLKIEKGKILHLLKQLQEDYLAKGKIEARVYEMKLESYNKRAGEIDSKLAELEAEKALKGALFRKEAEANLGK